MKKKLVVSIIMLAIVASSVACSNANSEAGESATAVEETSTEAASVMVSVEEATEEASLEATDETSQGISDEEFEKMRAMLDATGYLDGNAYENGFFNVRFELDDSFTFSNADELKELNGIDLDFDNEPLLTNYISRGNLVVIAHASDKKGSDPANNIFEVYMQGVTETGMYGDEKDYLEDFKAELLAAMPKAETEIDSITFLGEEHPSISVKMNVGNEVIYKRYVCLVKPQFVSLYSVMGRDADAVDKMINDAVMVR